MDSAVAIARAVRRRERSARLVVEDALATIGALEPSVLAWVHVDGAGALAAASVLDGRVVDDAAGPLAGVPVGIKDIIDVAGLPTYAGAPPFAHLLPDMDATVVARLREAGAIIAGKTHTTTFAYFDPAPTRNPWNTEHTPGGSSSGSAAAVAAGMVPVALGTQTVGSVLRPAAFCGVVGFKPGYGVLDTEGVIPLSWSLDHVGIFARSVEDIALVYDVLAMRDDLPVEPPERPRFGVPTPVFAEEASPPIIAHLDEVRRRLVENGAHVTEVLFPSTAEWGRAGQPVMAAEAAAFHNRWFDAHTAEYTPRLRELVERGRALPATDYVDANQARAALRRQVTAFLHTVDALLIPVAPTTAPRGLASTGDPAFCAPASYAGLPAISLPSGLDADGLPLAIQLVAAPGCEAQLLALAGKVETLLDFQARPPLARPER